MNQSMFSMEEKRILRQFDSEIIIDWAFTSLLKGFFLFCTILFLGMLMNISVGLIWLFQYYQELSYSQIFWMVLGVLVLPFLAYVVLAIKFTVSFIFNSCYKHLLRPVISTILADEIVLLRKEDKPIEHRKEWIGELEKELPTVDDLEERLFAKLNLFIAKLPNWVARISFFFIRRIPGGNLIATVHEFSRLDFEKDSIHKKLMTLIDDVFYGLPKVVFPSYWNWFVPINIIYLILIFTTLVNLEELP